jgi:DNA-binding NtrC family response regulator
MAYDWPGNVRELENVIERSFVLCGEDQIDIGHLPEDIVARHARYASDSNIRTARNIMETQTILSALERNNWNRSKTAMDLGIHKTTLFRKIERLGITLPPRDGRSKRGGK